MYCVHTKFAVRAARLAALRCSGITVVSAVIRSQTSRMPRRSQPRHITTHHADRCRLTVQSLLSCLVIHRFDTFGSMDPVLSHVPVIGTLHRESGSAPTGYAPNS